MIVRSLDSSGDWTFGNGQGNYLSQNNAIAQTLQTQLSTFLGECFFNVTVGVDWWNLLGYKNQAAIQIQCSAIILNLNKYGVNGIKEIQLNLDSSRNLQIVYDISTIFTGNVQGNFFVLNTEDGGVLTDEFGNPLIGG